MATSTDKNYNIIKNNKVVLNVMASRSVVDGMGTRLIDADGEVVYHDQTSSAVIVKGDKLAMGTSIAGE